LEIHVQTADWNEARWGRIPLASGTPGCCDMNVAVRLVEGGWFSFDLPWWRNLDSVSGKTQ